MFNDTMLLVVDDEETICQGCQRILTPAGFRVDTATDAQEGLNLAVENEYAAVLLDIRMPQMDGIEFLERLRKTKPDVPVIIITGYPSIASAAAAMQLGAVDYVMKPFTPRAITRAVGRLLGSQDIKEQSEPGPGPPSAQPWIPVAQEFRYWHESWFQPLKGGALRVGAMLPRARGGTVEAVWPPRVGWTVYQGLPLAGATITGSFHLTVPSPISGVVAARNNLLFERPSVLWDDPCGNGWIACVRPTRLEKETGNCKLRQVVLANANKTSAREQSKQLLSLGCQVTIAESPGDVGPALQQHPDCNVLIVDTESFEEHGPGLVGRIKAATPSTKIVAIASRRCRWESAYREQGIFYYAVDPFGDNEIVDIIDAVFRPQAPRHPQAKHRTDSSQSVGRICITTRAGKRVGLVAENGLLRRDLGLGRHIMQRLADETCAVKTMSGTGSISTAIHEATSTCERALILLARDVGRLPGSLVREEFVPASEKKAGKATTLIIQRASSRDDPLDFDARTTGALAEHIVHELTLP